MYAACYPSTFNPNAKPDTENAQGLPQFEANLKAGGTWTASLTVPEHITETAAKAKVREGTNESFHSCSWIIEISSQVLFSSTATVHFELLVGRDESSVELGSNVLPGNVRAPPGEVHDYLGPHDKKGYQHTPAKGVYSKAIALNVEDTASLWDKPHLPDCEWRRTRRPLKRSTIDQASKASTNDGLANAITVKPRYGPSAPRQKKIHLVVITHGLHSNIGADMLYLKESIDTAAREARRDRRKRKAAAKKSETGQSSKRPAYSSKMLDNSGSAEPKDSKIPLSVLDAQSKSLSGTDDSEEEEEVIVRGFSGNVIRTERGLQYLGKRLAKYVLAMTYPDQPVLPTKQSVAKKISNAFSSSGPRGPDGEMPSHAHSSIRDESRNVPSLPYRITSISFIGHSLGGLTQTYAIAYIQKHSPTFFQSIRPINFIALATPFLGLNHENPIYVKFALDFGLVGKTGQDLGLAWRAPNFARSGWAALIGGTGTEGQRSQRHLDPGSKPLLRLLPTGPAHQVLKMFRNRTVYANVVNDGIVPLRTSCLLFLDWRGLGRVEKARRENGLVGTMASWGWAEMTGINSSQKSHRRDWAGDGASPSDAESESGMNTPNDSRDGRTVPLPAENATADDTIAQSGVQGRQEPSSNQFLSAEGKPFLDEDDDAKHKTKAEPISSSNRPFSSFFSIFMPNTPNQNHHQPKHSRIYKRGQTIGHDQNENEQDQDRVHGQARDSNPDHSTTSHGDTLETSSSNVFAPPKTTVFEAAGDILNPPLPSDEYFIDPTTRPRTIFHDRIYHPEDIPPPPPNKRRSTLLRSLSGDLKSSSTRSSTYSGASESVHSGLNEQGEQQESSRGMKVEEKTARAYHKDLSWRKVLVRLEPDAHNNIIVRRMFSNAYGWPVIKHLVDTHFADTFAAGTNDSEEPSEERARPMDESVGDHGEEVEGQSKVSASHQQEIKGTDGSDVPLKSPTDTILSSQSGRPKIMREETAMTSWDDRYFEGSSDENDSESDMSRDGHGSLRAPRKVSRPPGSPKGTDEAEIADFLSASPQKADPGKESSIHEDNDSTPHTFGLPPALSLGSTKNCSTSVGLHALTHNQANFDDR